MYGDGDGFGASALAMVAADRAWLAADGALVLSTPACSVRALVPRTSPRARVALRRSAWHAFEDGELPYYAGAAGSLRLTVRRARGPVVFTATGTTEAG